MAHQNPDLHPKKPKKGLQICIWTDNHTAPTLMFHNCRNISDSVHELKFRYDGLSTGKTSNARFDKRNIIGYAIEHREDDPLGNTKMNMNEQFADSLSTPLGQQLTHDNIAKELSKQIAHGMDTFKGGL